MVEKHDGYEALKEIRMTPGVSLNVESRVSCLSADISDLAALPIEELNAMREKSIRGENTVLNFVRAIVQEWEEQAAITQRLDRAIAYVKTPAVEHTANQWQADEDGFQRRSNMVYTMLYRIKEDTKWDIWKSSGIQMKWRAEWNICLNKPVKEWTPRIAGQDKGFDTREAAERYLHGRIQAYAHLFTEISPPIPPEYAEHFKVNGLLLPGYTIEGQAPQRREPAAGISDGGFSMPKPSILGQLAEAKARSKSQPAQEGPAKGPHQEI